MGNIDSRAKFGNGYIYVKTDLEFYNPGQQVTGSAYLRIFNAIDAKQLMIRIKGTEKVSFWDHETKWEGQGAERKSKRVDVKRKAKRQFMTMRMPLFVFAEGPLQPGDY